MSGLCFVCCCPTGGLQRLPQTACRHVHLAGCCTLCAELSVPIGQQLCCWVVCSALLLLRHVDYCARLTADPATLQCLLIISSVLPASARACVDLSALGAWPLCLWPCQPGQLPLHTVSTCSISTVCMMQSSLGRVPFRWLWAYYYRMVWLLAV